MGKPNFSDEFKRDAVVQITERGYPVAEVSQRLGVSPHSLYAWKKRFAKVASGDGNKDAEIRQLKRELARVSQTRCRSNACSPIMTRRCPSISGCSLPS
ncbi:transposase [Sphingomonas sp. PvP107]